MIATVTYVGSVKPEEPGAPDAIPNVRILTLFTDGVVAAFIFIVPELAWPPPIIMPLTQ